MTTLVLNSAHQILVFEVYELEVGFWNGNAVSQGEATLSRNVVNIHREAVLLFVHKQEGAEKRTTPARCIDVNSLAQQHDATCPERPSAWLTTARGRQTSASKRQLLAVLFVGLSQIATRPT